MWRDLGATYPVLFDEDDAVSRNTYEIYTRPVFVLIDRDMSIVAQDLGPLGMEQIENKALDLLRGE